MSYSMITKNGYDIKMHKIKDGYRLTTELYDMGEVVEISRAYHGDDGTQEWMDNTVNSFCNYAEQVK